MSNVKSLNIILKTDDNRRVLDLLQSFPFIILIDADHIKIRYENIDQIPSICRLLVEANIDIQEIFTTV